MYFLSSCCCTQYGTIHGCIKNESLEPQTEWRRLQLIWVWLDQVEVYRGLNGRSTWSLECKHTGLSTCILHTYTYTYNMCVYIYSYNRTHWGILQNELGNKAYIYICYVGAWTSRTLRCWTWHLNVAVQILGYSHSTFQNHSYRSPMVHWKWELGRGTCCTVSRTKGPFESGHLQVLLLVGAVLHVGVLFLENLSPALPGQHWGMQRTVSCTDVSRCSLFCHLHVHTSTTQGAFIIDTSLSCSLASAFFLPFFSRPNRAWSPSGSGLSAPSLCAPGTRHGWLPAAPPRTSSRAPCPNRTWTHLPPTWTAQSPSSEVSSRSSSRASPSPGTYSLACHELHITAKTYG